MAECDGWASAGPRPRIAAAAGGGAPAAVPGRAGWAASRAALERGTGSGPARSGPAPGSESNGRVRFSAGQARIWPTLRRRQASRRRRPGACESAGGSCRRVVTGPRQCSRVPGPPLGPPRFSSLSVGVCELGRRSAGRVSACVQGDAERRPVFGLRKGQAKAKPCRSGGGEKGFHLTDCALADYSRSSCIMCLK